MMVYFVADRIHLSKDTKDLLDQLGGYITRDRGLTEIKVCFSNIICSESGSTLALELSL